MRASFNRWVGTGSPWVWITAGAVSLSLVMVFGLVSAVLFGLLGLGQLGSLLALPGGLFFSTLFYVSLVFTFNDSFGSQ